jgi:hypothetical protein
MSVEQIIKHHAGSLKVQRTGIVLPFDPREDEKRIDVFYYLRLPRENAEVELNYMTPTSHETWQPPPGGRHVCFRSLLPRRGCVRRRL